MSPAPKRHDAAAAKAAKQKKILIAGLVLLLAVVGFQAPKLLHALKKKAPVDTTALSAAQPTTPPATLVDDTPPQPGPGQLLSFNLFKSKDPFVQQIGSETTGLPPTGSPTPSTPVPTPTVPTPTIPTTTPAFPTTPTVTTPTTPTTPTTTTPTTPTVPSTTPTSTTPTTPTAPESVGLATNGVCQDVKVDDVFPTATPLFQLVSIAVDGKSAQISIAGGSLTGGRPTVTVTRTKPVTLVNTSDGLRYKIELLTSCAPTPGVTTPGATTPTTGVPTSVPSPTTTVPGPTTTVPASPSGTTPSASQSAAEASIRAIVPDIEAYFSDNSTYVGMTLAGLKSTYDPTLDTSKYLLPAAGLSSTSYCVQTPASGSGTYKKAGPGANVVPGTCPT